MTDLTKQELQEARLQMYLLELNFNADDNDSYFMIKDNVLYSINLSEERNKIDYVNTYLVDDEGGEAIAYKYYEKKDDMMNILKEVTNVNFPEYLF